MINGLSLEKGSRKNTVLKMIIVYIYKSVTNITSDLTHELNLHLF